MSLEVNLQSLSLIIFFGSPCSLKTLLRSMARAPSVVSFIFIGSKMSLLVNQSMITKMPLWDLDFGSGPIMSQEISSQGPAGIACGWSGLAHLVWSVLFR